MKEQGEAGKGKIFNGPRGPGVFFLAGIVSAQSPAAYPTRPTSITVSSIVGEGTEGGAWVLAEA
jgi:hypothetical protein